ISLHLPSSCRWQREGQLRGL
ncbi:unnamed protein product, partial [Allacma fusca]